MKSLLKDILTEAADERHRSLRESAAIVCLGALLQGRGPNLTADEALDYCVPLATALADAMAERLAEPPAWGAAAIMRQEG